MHKCCVAIVCALSFANICANPAKIESVATQSTHVLSKKNHLSVSEAAVGSSASRSKTVRHTSNQSSKRSTTRVANHHSAAFAKEQWNFQEADLRSYIQWVAKRTHKNFIVGPGVTGKVTVISGSHLPAKAIYPTFLTVLAMNGYTAVNSGPNVKILPLNDAKGAGVSLAREKDADDAWVVRVIKVKHNNAGHLGPVLQQLVPAQAHLAAVPHANVLVVSSPRQVAEHIAQVVERIDIANTDRIESITLQHATASDIANTAKELFHHFKNNGDEPLTIAADDRSNRLLISGDEDARLKIRALVAQLDTQPKNDGNTEVIYLKYQKAEDLVKVLSAITQSYYAAKKGKNPEHTAYSQQLQHPFMMHSSIHTRKPILDLEHHDSTPSQQRRSIGENGIQAEPHTNALVITAPPALMHTLKAVIAKLDIRRAQVLVEAIIAEISDDDSEGLGIEWQRVAGSGPFGVVSGGVDGVLSTLQGAAGLNALTSVGGGLALGFIHNGSIRGLLHALSTTNNTNILATPSVVALDNQHAKIRVVQTVPFDVGQYETQNPTSSVSPYITTEYRPVGLQLEFTPQITQDNAVQLQIMQETGSIEKGSSTPGKPITNNRSIDTTVLVDSGDILVLGGLISTDVKEEINKVPLLGDVPAVGLLFRTKKQSVEKRNLMIFIRPLILRDRNENVRITQQKYHFIRDQEILKHHQQDLDRSTPVLPGEQKLTLLQLPEPF